ncbi:hypothetical protein C8J98_104216 [Luteibacter sp. OK325]|uniref:hypothetical protein n=1 Tax=Luteibacter sp. OK325 TaxID=2135670 RepID=UPI000D33F466|nr:hypothetical protein [Luteibacter sp. OK325]PTR33005.1 hypothetical protein C8J98_104216 [Luteibacter sp. OK325]
MKKLSFRTAVVSLALAVSILVAGTASASTTIDATVNSWLVQDYPSGQGIVLWYTGSTCTNGQLLFNVGEPVERHNRLLAMILSAKAMGARMHVTYNVVNGSCLINDFGVTGP